MNVNGQVNLDREKAIDNILLLQHDWDWFNFQIDMLKSQNENYKSIMQLKDRQILDLKEVIRTYKEYSEESKPKFWQSPFFDVIFFLTGFIFATLTIIAIQ